MATKVSDQALDVLLRERRRALPPAAHIQTAERLPWMEAAHDLPAFARFPAG